MNEHLQNGSKQRAPRRHPPRSPGGAKPSRERPVLQTEAEALYERACHLIERGKSSEALGLLNAGAVTDRLRNLKGVCLLRMGRIEPASRLFRNLVMPPGATWVRPGTPLLVHVNYCTALLLDGHPVGCFELLAEVDDQQHPAVVRLRQAIAAWQQELSFWQKLQWWCGMEPDHLARLDFPPGDYEAAPVQPQTPGQITPPTGPRIAA